MQRDGAVIVVGWLGVAGVAVFIVLAWTVVSKALMVSWNWAASLF